jgi:hypothetical protein
MISHAGFANCVHVPCTICGEEHPVPVSVVNNPHELDAMLCDDCWDIENNADTDFDFDDYGQYDDYFAQYDE